jgi:hypothetical protein
MFILMSTPPPPPPPKHTHTHTHTHKSLNIKILRLVEGKSKKKNSTKHFLTQSCRNHCICQNVFLQLHIHSYFENSKYQTFLSKDKMYILYLYPMLYKFLYNKKKSFYSLRVKESLWYLLRK